jgi:hypothetical protein
MLATLLLALFASQAVAPPADDPWGQPLNPPGFCRDLTAMIAASGETPVAFASLKPAGKGDGEWSPSGGLDGMRWCRVGRYGGAAEQPASPSLRCGREAWGPVAESRAQLARAVEACTDVAPSTEPDDRPASGRDRETRFETAAWTLTLTEVGCDRCKGMPRVELRLTPKAPLS